MSWFRHRPKVKEPPKHLPHHRASPVTERILEETKNAVKEKVKKPKDINK